MFTHIVVDTADIAVAAIDRNIIIGQFSNSSPSIAARCIRLRFSEYEVQNLNFANQTGEHSQTL